jgi:ornithine racemase
MSLMKINLSEIIQNFLVVKEKCQENDIDLAVVTKCCCGDRNIIQPLIDAGVETIAEYHPEHFHGIEGEVQKMILHSSHSLLRGDFVCDFIFISELETLKKYSGSRLAKQSQVIIPVEMGDLRDGVPPEELADFLNSALNENIEISGFSANFGCFQATKPRVDWFNDFVQCAESEYPRRFRPGLLSIGGTSVWSLFHNKLLPDKINQLRIGEGIFLGYDPALKREIPGLSRETFKLSGEIIEIKRKKGHRARHNGLRRQAVIDFGYSSIRGDGLRCAREGAEIIGSSQDVTVIDITHTNAPVSVGDHLDFYPGYESLVRAMISPYIEKEYIF